MSLTTLPSTPFDSSLEALREQLCGAACVQGDPLYDALCATWNVYVRQQPGIVVSAETTADVQLAIAFARQHGMAVAVQSTGHGQFRTCEGGMLIRTSELNHVEIHPASRTATVGAGALWRDVLNRAQPFGLAGLSGSAPHVGVVGYMLGGGYNLMLRKHGMMVDSVLSVRIVTPDGLARTASRQENADLFWALMGGGGAFGVITEIEIQLYPEATIFGGSVFYPYERSEEVAKAYLRWTQDLAEEVTSCLSFMTFPPVPFVPEPLRGKSFVIVTACVAAPLDTAIELMRPMRELGDAAIDTYTEMEYSQSGAVFQDPVDPMPVVGNGVLLKSFAEEDVTDLLKAIGPIPQSPNLKIDVRHLGGAASRVAPEATAIGNRRSAAFSLYFLGVPMGPNTPDGILAHSESVIKAMSPQALCRGPLNFVGEGSVKGDVIREVFGVDGVAKMIEVKRRYDPENLFRHAGIGIVLDEG